MDLFVWPRRLVKANLRTFVEQGEGRDAIGQQASEGLGFALGGFDIA